MLILLPFFIYTIRLDFLSFATWIGENQKGAQLLNRCTDILITNVNRFGANITQGINF